LPARRASIAGQTFSTAPQRLAHEEAMRAARSAESSERYSLLRKMAFMIHSTERLAFAAARVDAL